MQLLNSDEPASETRSHPEKPQEESSSPATDSSDSTTDEGVALDVSGKSLEFSAVDEETAEDSAAESLYLYRNVYSLVPKWVGGLARLKTLKFFGNEVNLFAPEFRGMTALECLQMKISSPGIGGLPLHKLNGLKELELSRGPPRPSAFPLLAEIAALKRLTKLSICHFSIRYLPPEIGCLKNLEYLDLSFNKLKTLPSEISCLNSLITMKVANNKLVELPSTMTSLTRLESLDLSNNRLTSLGSIELGSMCRLQLLNLQYNKLLSVFHIPSWICCKLEGNDGGGCNDDCSSSSVEMDVYESSQQENDRTISNGAHNTSSSTLTSTSSSSRCFSARKSGKRWKRRFYLQQKARQERLNNSRKWKVVDQDQLLSNNIQIISESGNIAAASCKETVSDHVNLDDNGKKIFSEKEVNDNLSGNNKDEVILEKQFSSDNCHTAECKDERDASLNGPGEQDEQSLEILKCFSTKRYSDRHLDNPKPCKFRKPIVDASILACKYSKFSICGIEDHLSDGFYDAGRDRPFMPLESYEQNQCLDSREVILLDRKRDEELDAVLLSAQALVTNLKKLNGLNTRGMHAVVDSLQTASLLALFVSDHFGGSDRSAMVERTRKSVSGSNYNKPFVCTCSAGSSTSMTSSKKPAVNTIEDITLSRISEQCIDSIKKRRSSIIVPIGSVQYGVCRHRALLLKYLCDHMVPAVPCELVRGYLDFSPHAWNIILIKRGDTWVRMLVDACRPHDIREEKDPEYFCRYVPLSRATIPLSSRGSHGPDCLFPSLSTCDELKKKASTTLVQCKIGSVEAAAKVRTLDVQGSSAAEIRNFDYNCLGEVRILGSLKHPCIVEMYGHEISCQWTFTADGKPHNRILRSAIFMEYVDGGSLKNYLEKLSEAGEKHVPMELALYIARDVSSALSELHSKHIIHRDIKSENILFDLDRKTDDGTPTVKLCDFDSAVPLRSRMHACCIAHMGTPPPSVCVGTPRWMAPEVMRTMYEKRAYGLEADIWSFGCLLLEILTLQIPYYGVPDSDIHDSLQMGKRPRLIDELEALSSMSEPSVIQSGEDLEKSDAEADLLKFLVGLFHRCMEENPAERPTAKEIHEMLLARTGRLQAQDDRKI
ncbi:uncharacterized protein LOC107467022 isoform X1 [Arachis duranensis]|uniref:Uncharacterized protein LOC107467022 isoform X1 n=1 Tax=Arachis duranensis TaxID=130453 RepID=A0A6P4BKI3_ARADU|nr:uncharacterized protein LOC107467022 isoform X1 [Arachis duranensis]